MLHKADYTIEDYFLLFKQGEEQGFNYFFSLYFEPLVHFAFTMVKEKSDAEDIVEDSFVKFWEKREDIEQAHAVKSYLYTMVRNAAFNWMERQNSRNLYVAHMKKLPLETAPDCHQNIIIAESMHQVYLALENLPPKCRQIFTMMYVQGKPAREIAEELQISVSTVKSHKAKALELLRKQLPHLGSILIFIFFH